jgi:hypothetical protein
LASVLLPLRHCAAVDNVNVRERTISKVVTPYFGSVYTAEPITNWDDDIGTSDEVKTRFFKVRSNGNIYVCAVPEKNDVLDLPKIICQKTGTYTIPKPPDRTQKYIATGEFIRSLYGDQW